MRIVLLLPFLALPAFAEEVASDVPLPPRPVMSERVNLQAGDRVRFVGLVAAEAETDLGFPLSGTIVERPVDTGHMVAKGALLARLDAEDLEADVRKAEAGVAVATAQLRAASDAETRARDLSERGVDSATRLEDATRARTAAEARLEQAKATLARTEDMRGLATLTAPQDGVITQVFAEAGARVAAGAPVLRLAGADAREIAIDVTEQDAASLNIGTLFDATLAANPRVTAQAKLTRIDPVAARATRTRRIHLTLIAPPIGFRLGALVTASPVTIADLGVTLDRSSVVQRESGPAVWVVDRRTNTVHLTPVILGADFGSRVRISEGLKAGDEVVIKGINSLEDGQIVGPSVQE